ncbi:MAG: hypothetical protein ABFE01_24840 [Phycisphaerales bacterium]|jgi:hypothetical protein
MNSNDEEYTKIERLLKRARPTEPSAELKSRVLHAARETWLGASAGIPWQTPVRRLIVSAVAATIVVSLANVYADRAFAPGSVSMPAAGYMEPCEIDVMAESDTPQIYFAATAVRAAQPDASTLFDHLEKVRETLREVDRDESSGGSMPIPPGSRLHQVPSSVNS